MSSAATPEPLTRTQQILILAVAIIGFAFDIYELLMLPVISGPAISELLQVPIDNPAVTDWFTLINSAAAISGGIFGLLGGYLIDRFGRKRILVLSIVIYGFSPLAAAFSTDIYSFMIFRCTTFIGVCVEFVAAVAWLAELFPDKKQREAVLGFTQAFSSFGGLMVTGMNVLAVKYASDLPALPVEEPFNAHASWRYTLISGLIPAIPIMIMLPFLPESPMWQRRRAEGTLKRPTLGALFTPEYRRTTIVVSILFACAYGAAFGAIQLTPTRITPGLPELAEQRKVLKPLQDQAKELNAEFKKTEPGSEQRKQVLSKLAANRSAQKKDADIIKDKGNTAQFFQELGGLAGRIFLAIIALIILNRRIQLWIFLVPGLFLVPYVFMTFLENDMEYLKWGIFAAAFVTVAQYSYWGNYLPVAYPIHLRGTAGGFAANVGGRMIGGSMGLLTSFVLAPMFTGSPFVQISKAAAVVGGLMFLIAVVASFWLPNPKETTES